MSDFHGRIMNIPCVNPSELRHVPGFKLGHKAARHAAAEIALEADADNERLRAFNESVAVCQAHVAEVTRGGCLVCEAEAANEQNERLLARLDGIAEVLRVAKCPACDGSGGIPHQVGEREWEQQQCQWCFERTAFLAAQEVPE